MKVMNMEKEFDIKNYKDCYSLIEDAIRLTQFVRYEKKVPLLTVSEITEYLSTLDDLEIVGFDIEYLAKKYGI